MSPPPYALLVAFLAFVALQRLAELVLSARNARIVLARGAREFGREHFRWFVLIHLLFPIALVAEVVFLGARPGPWAPLWDAAWVAAQFLRLAAIRALGERWNVRILVLPGVPLVTRGPYRWLRHPNYVAVMIESVAAPLMFGAWRTAIAFAVANALALRVRIGCENHALTAARPAGTA